MNNSTNQSHTFKTMKSTLLNNVGKGEKQKEIVKHVKMSRLRSISLQNVWFVDNTLLRTPIYVLENKEY